MKTAETHEHDENDEDNSDGYKQGAERWVRGNHGNRKNDKNHRNPGCKPQVPQTTGLEYPTFGPPKEKDPPRKARSFPLCRSLKSLEKKGKTHEGNRLRKNRIGWSGNALENKFATLARKCRAIAFLASSAPNLP